MLPRNEIPFNSNKGGKAVEFVYPVEPKQVFALEPCKAANPLDTGGG